MKLKPTRLDEIPAAVRNPRTHNMSEIKASILELGFNDPPCVDERTGRMVEGHGRVEALTELMKEGKEPPANVTVDKDGMWKVPVIRGVEFKDDAHAEKYILAHNRLVERGGWDMAMLGEIFTDLGDLNVEVIGWGAKEVDRIVKANAPEPPGEFREHGEFMHTQYTCPKCGYAWNKG